jgi:O-antigen biosynthesis protein
VSRGFPRVAVTYDDTQRPDTTGGYCLRAFGPGATVEHIPPARLPGLDPAAFELFLSIDDGLATPFPGYLHPSAFWAIDTHLDFARALRRARDFDVVFAAQREGAARLREEGIAVCEWLPLACDPEIHRRLSVEKQWEVAFVGHVVSEGRHRLLTRVQQAFPNSRLGPAPHTEMGEIYSRARIVINHALNNDLNMRVFEAMACGALLVTPRLHANGQEELFQDRVHLVEYRDEEEALELIRYYLDHPEEREAIAEAGYREVTAHHTYRQRMARVLARMEEYVQEHPTAPERQTRGAAEPPRDRQYFHWARPDLLALVPRTARRVLDVG